VQFAEVILAVEHHEDLPGPVGDPAQFADCRQRFGDVVEHVHGQGQAAGVIPQRQGSGVCGDQGRSRCAAAGGLQHAYGQVDAQHRACMPAAGQLSQVCAIAAADIGDGFAAAQGGKPEHP